MKIGQVVEVEPHYLRPPNARRYTDLPWEIIRQGIEDGHIKSVWLRNRYRKTQRAIQLIDRASLIFYIENFAHLYGDPEATK
jgi:hypothetical protein